MEIVQRGQPPYRVSSGEIPKIKAGPEHWSAKVDFLKALQILFDLSEAGQDSYGARIVDATNATVFTTNNPNDVLLLKQMDAEGLDKLKVT